MPVFMSISHYFYPQPGTCGILQGRNRVLIFKYLFFIEYVSVILVNKIIEISGDNSVIPKLHIALYSLPQIMSLSITIYVHFTLSYLNPAPISLWWTPYYYLSMRLWFFNDYYTESLLNEQIV